MKMTSATPFGNYTQEARLVNIDNIQDILTYNFGKSTTNKNNIPRFNCFTFKDIKSSINTLQQKYLETCALILDYDSINYTINDAINDFKQYEFYLHTSNSHTPEHHKFRIILPLSKNMSWKEYSNAIVKKALIRRFNNIDPSTFNNNRLFCLPNFTKDYYHYSKKGELFDYEKELFPY